MTLILLNAFIILTFLFALLKHTKSALFCLILTEIYIVLIGNGSIAAHFIKPLESSFKPCIHPKWGRNNVIVLLSSGNVSVPGNLMQSRVLTYVRIYETARLYFRCMQDDPTHACTILISGGNPAHNSASEASVYQNALSELSIPRSKILLEDASKNTYQNAEFSSAMIKKHAFDRVFLVTSTLHLKRSLLFFNAFGIHATPVPAGYFSPKVSWTLSSLQFPLVDHWLHEYLGTLQFYIYEYFGFNAPRNTHQQATSSS